MLESAETAVAAAAVISSFGGRMRQLAMAVRAPGCRTATAADGDDEGKGGSERGEGEALADFAARTPCDDETPFGSVEACI